MNVDLEWTALAALLLAAVHLGSSNVREWVRGRFEIVAPVSAGALAAYIFLHMLPSLEETENQFGAETTIVVLAGFVFYFGIESYLDERPHRLFWVKVAVGWAYSFLIVYALPSELETAPGSAAVATIALALHVVQSNNRLATTNEKAFDAQARYVLATSPLAAWTLDLFVQPSDETAAFLSAFVSGILLLGLFRDELGEGVTRRRFPLFLAGLAAYGALVGVEELLA